MQVNINYAIAPSISNPTSILQMSEGTMRFSTKRYHHSSGYVVLLKQTLIGVGYPALIIDHLVH